MTNAVHNVTHRRRLAGTVTACCDSLADLQRRKVTDRAASEHTCGPHANVANLGVRSDPTGTARARLYSASDADICSTKPHGNMETRVAGGSSARKILSGRNRRGHADLKGGCRVCDVALERSSGNISGGTAGKFPLGNILDTMISIRSIVEITAEICVIGLQS